MRLRVLPVELDVLVRRVQTPRDLRLRSLVGSDYDARRAVELQQLGDDKPGRARTKHECFDADAGPKPVHSVDSARGGLDQSRLLVRDVMDLVHLSRAAASSRVSGERLEREMLDD